MRTVRQMKVRRNDQWTFFEWKSAEKNGCSRPAVPRNGRNFPIIWLQTATFSTGPSWLIDFLFFLIIFVIFFVLSLRSQWTESKSKQQGRSPDKTKMTPGAAPNLDRIKVWSPAWEEINDYLFIESSLHWPKLKTFMRSSWNVNCESWLKIDAVFRRQ